MTAEEMVAGVKPLVADWQYDVASIGYPGVVIRGKPLHELRNLGGGRRSLTASHVSSCGTSAVGGPSMVGAKHSSPTRTGATTSYSMRYFHGDNGAGLGASHQTGWTGLVGTRIQLFGAVDAQHILEVGKMAAFGQSPVQT